MSPWELELLSIGKPEAEVTLRDQLICANASQSLTVSENSSDFSTTTSPDKLITSHFTVDFHLGKVETWVKY